MTYTEKLDEKQRILLLFSFFVQKYYRKPNNIKTRSMNV